MTDKNNHVEPSAEKAREKDSQNQEASFPLGAKNPKLIKR